MDIDIDKDKSTKADDNYNGTWGDGNGTISDYPLRKRTLRKRNMRERSNRIERKTAPDTYETENNIDWDALDKEEKQEAEAWVKEETEMGAREETEDKYHDIIDVTDSEIAEIAIKTLPLHMVVKHENKRYGLIRQERGARTEADFEGLVETYDKIDINRTKREQRYEKASTDDFAYYALQGHQRVFPQPFNHVWWRDLLNGDFLDIIHDCPLEIQEFFAGRNMYELLSALKDTQKEVLYYRAIRSWSNQRIAALRGQTDRNILKTYETMIESLRYKLYMRLLPRYKAEIEAIKKGIAIIEANKYPLSFAQRKFMKDNETKYGEGKPKRKRRTKVEMAATKEKITIANSTVDSNKNK